MLLTPTRELAVQVYDSFRNYGRHVPLRYAVVYGGVPIEPQTKELLAGVEILVATRARRDQATNVHLAAMAGQLANLFPAFALPDADHAIVAPGDDMHTVRREGDGPDGAVVEEGQLRLCLRGGVCRAQSRNALS